MQSPLSGTVEDRHRAGSKSPESSWPQEGVPPALPLTSHCHPQVPLRFSEKDPQKLFSSICLSLALPSRLPAVLFLIRTSDKLPSKAVLFHPAQVFTSMPGPISAVQMNIFPWPCFGRQVTKGLTWPSLTGPSDGVLPTGAWSTSFRTWSSIPSASFSCSGISS